MHNKIAPALERAKRRNGEAIELLFPYSNLDEQAVLRLASAIEKSTCLVGIDSRQNPGYNARTREVMKNAIIASESPITTWNGNDLPKDIVQTRLEHRAKMKVAAFLSALRTRVPNVEEFQLAQREAQSIPPQIASKKEELEVAMQQVAQEEAQEKVLGEHLRELEKQLREHEVQLQGLEKSVPKSTSRKNKVELEVDALKLSLVRHEAVIKYVEDMKELAALYELLPSAAAAAASPQTQDANLCSICFENDINASLLCGHRFCQTCADAVFQSEKKECPNCRKRIKAIIPSY